METTNFIDSLASLYRDFVNNYLTVERFAEHYGLTNEEAMLAIKLGKLVHERTCKPQTVSLKSLPDGAKFRILPVNSEGKLSNEMTKLVDDEMGLTYYYTEYVGIVKLTKTVNTMANHAQVIPSKITDTTGDHKE